MSVIALILDVIANGLGDLGASGLESLLRQWANRKRRPEPPRPFIGVYLDKFLAVVRAPRWDPDILTPERIGKSKVRVGERVSENDLEVTETDEGTRPTHVQTLTVEQFLEKILFQFIGKRWQRRRYLAEKRVFVLLGKPACGKSILVLQLAELLARQAKLDRSLPIPIYVNLTHFHGPYSLDTAGLKQLIGDSVRHSCPRYLPADPRPGNGRGDEIERQILNSPPEVRKLYIFDGMDEMPVLDELADEQNSRIKTLADFIEANSQHFFLVTCRINDYLLLRDYNQDFRLTKLEVLPWNRKMFLDYLDSRKNEGQEALDAVRGSLQRAGERDTWGQFSDSPLLAALLFGGAGLKQPTTMSEVWGNFIRAAFPGAEAANAHLRPTLEKLEEYAFARTLDPRSRFLLPPEISEKSVRSGLLVPHKPNPEFAIKPLQQYFAARYLWRHIENRSDEIQGLEITHPKLRVVFMMVAEIAGNSCTFAEYLMDQLGKKGDPVYLWAERFELFLTALTTKQLKAAPDLQAALLNTLRQVIERGTSGDFDLCVKGIELMPDVLLADRDLTRRSMTSVLSSGTLEIRRRLFQLMVSRPAIAFAFPSVLARLSQSFLRQARLDTELIHLFDAVVERRLGHSAFSDLLCLLARLARLLALGVFVYSVYVASLLVADVAIDGSARLFGLSWEQGRTIPFLPTSPLDWLTRAGFLIPAALIPWLIIRRLARAEYRFVAAGMRLVTLFAASAFIRYVLLVPFLGINVLNTIYSTFEYVILTFAFVAPAGVTLVGLSASRRLTRGQPVFVPYPSPSPDEDRPEPPVWPPRAKPGIVGRALIRLRALIRESLARFVSHAKRRRLQLLLILGAFSLAIALLLVYHLEKVVYVLVALAILALVLITKIVAPYREYRSLSKRLQAEVLAELAQEFEATVDRILAQIGNRSLPAPFRKRYVHLLETNVRWNPSLLEKFERASQRPDLPREIRSYMQVVATRKRKEIQQNTNPRWDRETHG